VIKNQKAIVFPHVEAFTSESNNCRHTPIVTVGGEWHKTDSIPIDKGEQEVVSSFSTRLERYGHFVRPDLSQKK